jgi:choline dehydrogenase-like flavoprotein
MRCRAWHTCRIGTDRLAVVDPELRVRGIDRLRVADASVMPSGVSGKTQAATYGIAKCAAAFVAADRLKGEPDRVRPAVEPDEDTVGQELTRQRDVASSAVRLQEAEPHLAHGREGRDGVPEPATATVAE